MVKDKLITSLKIIKNIVKINKLSKELYYKHQIFETDFLTMLKSTIPLVFEAEKLSYGEFSTNLYLPKDKKHRYTYRITRKSAELAEGFIGKRSLTRNTFFVILDILKFLKGFPASFVNAFTEAFKTNARLATKIAGVILGVVIVILSLLYAIPLIIFSALANDVKGIFNIFGMLINTLSSKKTLEESYEDSSIFASHLSFISDCTLLMRWLKYENKSDAVILKTFNDISKYFSPGQTADFFLSIFRHFRFYHIEEKRHTLLERWDKFYDTDFNVVTETLLKQRNSTLATENIPEDMDEFLQKIETLKMAHDLSKNLTVKNNAPTKKVLNKI